MTTALRDLAPAPPDAPVFTADDAALLRGYANWFRVEQLSHPRLAELEDLAQRLERAAKR